ncbi:N-acetylmuramoyl-L-alanine amidase [Streptomyces sp. NPDC001985]|uniref:peptidoglycan recognition protein family protein n=1 Tax=Streptomyces sp. NPDC001985 TaxID=3154406 RepID=UPI003320A3E8
MRGFLATSIGVAVSTALALPLAPPSGDSKTPPPPAAETPGVPGSTRSLPLAPQPTGRTVAPPSEHGRFERRVAPFSMAGVVWDDPGAELHGTVEIRTRATATRLWSGWQSVETHNHEHGADPDTPESRSARGSTAPLWVGRSDGVEVRVRPERGAPRPLPRGLRLELVDPGDGSGAVRAPANRQAAGRPGMPAPDALPEQAAAKPYIGPRPKIVTRKGWKASESLRERGFVYSKTVKAAFVHHSATGNGYTCKQAPSVLRGIYRYHVVSSGWRDIGYNFAVDKCGNVYEGRAGGVTKAVRGAHTLGFNTNSMGIAVLGSYGRSNPPAAAVTGVARLTAWKLGLFKGNPQGKVTLTSGGSGKYAKGRKVRFNVISGHRDGFYTECPGARLYGRLGTARKASAGYQGRV